MTILVLAEHEGGALKPATLNTVTAAAKIGGDIHVLVAGDGVGAVAGAAARWPVSPRCCAPMRRSTAIIWPSRWRR